MQNAHTPETSAPAGSARHVASVLDFLTCPTQPGFFPRRRLRRIGLHDEDSGRAWGDGESIRGSGLTVCGRTLALERLGGPELPALQSRLT